MTIFNSASDLGSGDRKVVGVQISPSALSQIHRPAIF